VTAESASNTEGFERRVGEWVLDAIEEGVTGFDDLLERLPSVYPTVVIEAVRALACRGILKPELAAFLTQPGKGVGEEERERSVLPLPHPLNYEWRFTSRASNLLLNLADYCAPSCSTIVLFGTPSVAATSLTRATKSRVVFIGEDNPVTRRVSTLNKTVGSPLIVEGCRTRGVGDESASVVILDPPWYMDFVRPMLTKAADLCVIGGHLLISLPSEGTRSKAIQDRGEVLALAEQLCLVHVETSPLALRYETPFFEANALAACGIVVSGTWRRGDLLVFRKLRRSNHLMPTSPPRARRWFEVGIGRMRVFVCGDCPSDRGGLLSSLVRGDILPAVSRRDERRRAACVWTSGNRIFGSIAPAKVVAAALAPFDAKMGSRSHLQITSMKEHHELHRLGYLLRSLSALEAEENAARSTAQKNWKWKQPWTLTSSRGNGTLASFARGRTFL
jgi:hypothetical protein